MNYLFKILAEIKARLHEVRVGLVLVDEPKAMCAKKV